MRPGEHAVVRSASIHRVSGVVLASLLGACGSATHSDPDAGEAADDADLAASSDAGIDSAPAYDCEAACSREPPICDPPVDATPCVVKCRRMAIARRCVFGENLRLLQCLEENPGACGQGFDGPCAAEWQCYEYCSGDYPVVCRPPRE